MKRAITTYDVFVGTFDGDLANDVVERKVSKMFIKFGETKGLFVKENNQGKFVVVKYLCDQDAEKAVADCNGALLDGVPVKCYRMEKRNKPGGPGGGAGLGSKDSQQKKVFQKNPDIVPSVEPRASSSPGPEGESVMITHIETPTLVWAQLVSDATIEEQMTITQKLAEKCPVAPKAQGRTDPTKIYGAQFSEDGLWYRCQVRMAFNPDRVKVQYIDFGNSEEVNPKDLVELPEELTMPKPFAMKIMFHNVRYIHSKEKEATAFLKEVTEGNYVTVTPTFRLPDGSGQFAHLSIGGLNLNQELVERGFATQKQPKQPSQGPGDGFGRPSSMGGDSSGYGPGLGMGGSGVMGGGGDATFRQVPSQHNFNFLKIICLFGSMQLLMTIVLEEYYIHQNKRRRGGGIWEEQVTGGESEDLALKLSGQVLKLLPLRRGSGQKSFLGRKHARSIQVAGTW
ncbi:hypothetical protein BaRGS_00001497 [Batillaria attramentaria]|uniref:Uncharacterized protein n=1 Tax=Batillaria attramentaria TaxID=370345 RepID=A0ABD0M7Q4_9CAEN